MITFLHSLIYTLELYQKQIFYKSDLTPNPGPGGGDVNDVSPPAGSAANLGQFCGPGGGLSPFLRAFITAVAVSGVKSSYERENKNGYSFSLLSNL